MHSVGLQWQPLSVYRSCTGSGLLSCHYVRSSAAVRLQAC